MLSKRLLGDGYSKYSVSPSDAPCLSTFVDAALGVQV
jgi:hypothetical protein